MRRFSLSIVVVVTLSTLAASGVGAASALSDLDGTIWVGDRVSPTAGPELVGIAASSGAIRFQVDLDAPASDVAAGKGNVFVGEESLNRIAVIDAKSGAILNRIETGAMPHHLTASRTGKLVVYSAFGTNRLGVIDVKDRALRGEWPATTDPSAKTHAAAFSPDGDLIYAASEPGIVSTLDARTGELLREVSVPFAHELIVSRDGRLLYVSARTADQLLEIDLASWDVVRSVSLSRPDTLQLTADERYLTVGLRTSPARVVVVDLATFTSTEVLVGGAGTLAGHQWTSPDGRRTYVAFEGPGAGISVIDHQTLAVTTIPYPGGGRPHGMDYNRHGSD